MGTYSFNYRQPDYSEYVNKLFENTKDGVLTISGWYFDDEDKTDAFYRCHLNWNEVGRDKLIADFKHFYSQLEEIAKAGCRHTDDSEQVRGLLRSDLFDIWNTYIRKFEADSDPKYDYMTKKDIEDYNEEEKILMEEYFAANHVEAKKRLCDNEYACDLIWRARRVTRLIQINAPAFIVSNEAKTMLEVMLLYRFCVEKEELTLDDFSVKELETGANEFWMGGKLNSDSAESLRFALKAVEKGSNKMYKLIARLYSYGIGEAPADYVKSAEYYELALEKQEFTKPELEKKQIYEELMALYWHPEKANDLEKALKYRELYLSSEA